MRGKVSTVKSLCFPELEKRGMYSKIIVLQNDVTNEKQFAVEISQQELLQVRNETCIQVK